MSNDVVTPQLIERRLRDLSHEVDESHDDLVNVESKYHQLKAAYEVSMARSRIKYASISSPSGKNYTVGEREDMATVENEELHLQMATVEAMVKASRANAARLKTQVDIARSIGTSVRTSMDAI
jgi:hypothetical protein